MKTLRIKFADYYGIEPKKIGLYRLLSNFYDIELVERNPDYLIDGGLGMAHLDYPDAVRLVCIGESYVPDFNQFDYAIGFDDISFGDRYLRSPLFARYGQFKTLCELKPPTDDEKAALLKRGFCSFVVSNDEGDPLRIEFFKRLSKYKPVASGGKVLNNVGGRVADKAAFIANYKFNIAFENSTVPGYTTEKVMEPLAVRSVPIYYGNPDIAADFNPDAMVRVASRDDVERAVEEVIRLDQDDAAYLEKVTAPSFVHSFAWHEERLTAFLRHIFDQDLDAARRLNAYGYQRNIRHRADYMRKTYIATHPKEWLKALKRRFR